MCIWIIIKIYGSTCVQILLEVEQKSFRKPEDFRKYTEQYFLVPYKGRQSSNIKKNNIFPTIIPR